jgi:hypothetical protein
MVILKDILILKGHMNDISLLFIITHVDNFVLYIKISISAFWIIF